MKQILSVFNIAPLGRLFKGRWLRYVILGAIGNTFIWGSSLEYLKITKPIYTSEWGLILSSGSSGVSLNLPEIGQASGSSGSGLGSATYDPRANYEYIFTSEPILKAAATIAKIPLKEFKKPRMKLLNNTTIMQFEVTGRSPKEAHDKSLAIYQAIVQEVNLLRSGELSQRGKPSRKILFSAQQKLEQTQKRLSEYKISSGLSFPEQIANLSTNIEQLRRLHAENNAQEQLADKRVQQLSQDLGLSPSEAAMAFQLRVDQIFQENLKDYSESTTTLAVLMTKFGPNHPQVIKESKRQEVTGNALVERGKYLSGQSLTLPTLSRLALAVNVSGRDTLFQNLVSYQSERQGLKAQVKALDSSITTLEKRLSNLSAKQSTLDKLKREQQIAEAVFASTLTKLDLGQGDVFSTYPLIQIAMEPTTPTEATAPKKTFVLAGAAAGSVFTTLGLFLVWIRKPWLKKLDKLIS